MRVLLAVAVSCFVLAWGSSAFAQADWCWDMDLVHAIVTGNTITVHHDATVYNCCPTDFVYDVTIEGSDIRVVEHEILEMPCSCLCCYNLSVDIENVPPGEYSLIFVWTDYEQGGQREWPLHVVVHAAGEGGELRVVPDRTFECIENQDVPEDIPEPPADTWSEIKKLFRQ